MVISSNYDRRIESTKLMVFGKNVKIKIVGISECDCHDLLSASLAMTKTKI